MGIVYARSNAFGNLYVSGQVLAADGSESLPGIAYSAQPGTGFYRAGSGLVNYSSNGTGRAQLGAGTIVVSADGGSFGIAAGGSFSPDVIFARDAAGAGGFRNSTNAQTLGIYTTYTSSTSYERLGIVTNAGTTTQILTQKGSGGGTVRPLQVGTEGAAALHLATNNANRWSVGASDGHLTAASDNTYDIGASGATRPRNGYFSADGIFGGALQSAGVSYSKAATAITAGGVQAFGTSSTGAFGIYTGSGAPTVTAAKGSLYLRSDGSGVGDRAYINSDGGATWTALTTAA